MADRDIIVTESMRLLTGKGVIKSGNESSQVVRPESDRSRGDGDWTTTAGQTLAEELDEETADDATTMIESRILAGEGDFEFFGVWMGLPDSAIPPANATGHKVRVTFRLTDPEGVVSDLRHGMWIVLYIDEQVIHTEVLENNSTSWTEIEVDVPLSAFQGKSLTYSSIKVRVVSFNNGSLS